MFANLEMMNAILILRNSSINQTDSPKRVIFLRTVCLIISCIEIIKSILGMKIYNG